VLHVGCDDVPLEGRTTEGGRQRTLDEPAGRKAPIEALRRHLATAPPAYLQGAARNAALGVGELLLLLRNREAPAPLLQAIGRDRGWAGSYRVKRALALHPRTPLVLGRDLVRHLFWKELVELSVAPHVNPAVRRLAERYLKERLDAMALGERIALARRASRGLIGSLCGCDEEPVLRALLGNPCLVEADAVMVASSDEAPRALLAHLAEHPKWGMRRDVFLALARNERTPVPAALRILHRLGTRELRELCREPALPAIVRIGAERRLAPQSPSPVSEQNSA
jgi:hypothetical protein